MNLFLGVGTEHVDKLDYCPINYYVWDGLCVGCAHRFGIIDKCNCKTDEYCTKLGFGNPGKCKFEELQSEHSVQRVL